MKEESIKSPVSGANPKSKKNKAKFALTMFGCLTLCIVVSGVSGLFLWYGGYIEDFTCNWVKEDSRIWNKFDCKSNQQVDPDLSVDSKYKYNIIKNEGDTVVTDLEEVVVDVVEKSAASVVSIGLVGETPDLDRIIGSGFIVAENGLIVTNQHVVSLGEAKDFFVLLPGDDQPLNVQKIYRDEINDIALIEIEKTGLPTLPLGDSDQIKVGQTVIAIGDPLGTLSGTVTVGSISGVNRDVQVASGTFNFQSKSFSDVIQTDAAINPGNSGGPLLNSQGEVIGVNFATIDGADNLSFALPINRVKSRIDELNEFGNFRIPFLGVEHKTRIVFFDDKTVVGAVIVNVIKNSPADKAGILAKDIIVEFNRESLEDNSLINIIQQSKIGEEITVVVIRDQKLVTLKVKIGDRSQFETE